MTSGWQTTAPVPGSPTGRATGATTTEVVTCQSRWIFDLTRHRYLRCGHDEATGAATQFGSWRPFAHVTVTDAQLEVKEPGHPVLRAQIHREACDCTSSNGGTTTPRSQP